MAVVPIPTKYAEGEGKHARTQYVSEYVTDLRTAIGYYTGWIPENLNKIEEYWEIIQNDAAVKHAIDLLALMTAGEYFTIKGENKDFNRLALRALMSINRFAHSRKALVEKSVLFGLAVQKKKWKKVTWREFHGMTWEVPVALDEVDRRRMRIERDLEDKSRLYWTIWCPKTDKYMIIDDKADEPNSTLAMQDFLWLYYEHEEDKPYFVGLGQSIFQLAYIKNKTIQLWAELGENWGKPMMIASMDAARAAFNSATNSTGHQQDADAVVSNWLDLLENMRARHVAVMPDHDKLQVFEGGSTGNNILQGLIEYCDEKIMLLILGAEITSSPSVGSYAARQISKGATNSKIMYLRGMMTDCITRDLLFDFYLRNRHNFAALNIPWPGVDGVSVEFCVEQEEQRAELLEQQGNKKDLESMGVTE